MSARYLIGDVRDRLRELPNGSVDLIMTSPPFLALRSYLPADHPNKHLEIGSEPTPAEFLHTLLGLTAEWGRVLAPHGSIVVELGDTYSGSGGAGGDYADGRDRRGVALVPEGNKHGPGWPRAKSLALIPQLYAVALSYGIHPLTGEPSPAGQWLVRNVVAWCRPNPPVGALGDKFRPATSYLTIACRPPSPRSPRRYFDLDAVREPHKSDPVPGNEAMPGNPAGAPPLDWWEIPTSPYRGAHYATYPDALCVRPILSMCPQRVCRTCGEPSRREVEHERTMVGKVDPDWKLARSAVTGGGAMAQSAEVRRTTIGWTDCGHDDWRSGVVLDPFAGSGTTLAVAVGHGRHAIGIDLDERNAELALRRVGPLVLEVER